MIFRKFGGSYQYFVSTPEELPEILRLDPALWAALCVPVSALNADRKFLSYLDADASGMIRLDDVTAAVKTVQKAFVTLAPLADVKPELEVSALNGEDADGKALLEFVASVPQLAENGVLGLGAVTAKLDEVASGALRGDGVLRPAAVAGSGAEELFDAVLGVSGAGEGVTSAQLDKFVADANSFLEWSKETERPQFRGSDPEPYYAALEAVRSKVDEYFRFCELIRLDPAHAKRFRLDPDNLPPLDIRDGAAVTETLLSAPLAAPDAAAELALTSGINPAYREAVETFAGLFGIEKLTPESYAALQAELAPYADYLSRAQGDNIGRLGVDKLTACLTGGKEEILRGLFVRDGKVGSVLGHLRTLEKLILFKQYLWPFANNFVCFKALFSADDVSMIQAGRLVMDGRTFTLALWIDAIASHKAIAVKSNLCLIYLELATPGGAKKYAAVAVTAGDLKRIYVGKPAFFIDSKGVQYNGRIVDLVAGPISFWQTLLAPFRRLGALIGGKAQKLTDFSSQEKAMAKQIDTTSNKISAPQAPAPAKSGGMFGGNSTMLLLAGGLSLAAVGAAASYAVKTIAGVAASIAAMPPLRLCQLLLTIFLIIFTPLALYALLQLRKRNLTLFLEAAGWAVNLPMRLSSRVSRFFTFFGIYPEDAKFKVLERGFRKREDIVRRRRRRRIVLLVVLAVLIVVAGHLWRSGRICRWRACFIKSRQCRAAKPAAKPESKPAAKPEAKPEVKLAAKPESKPAAKPEAKPEVKPAAKPEAKPEMKPAAKPEAKPEVKPAAKPAPEKSNA